MLISYFINEIIFTNVMIACYFFYEVILVKSIDQMYKSFISSFWIIQS